MDKANLQIWAHRGGAHLGVSNTIGAAQAALSHHVSGIHINLQRLNDDTLVLFDDDTFDEATNGSGWVHQTSRAQCASIRHNGEEICTLETFIRWFLRTIPPSPSSPTLNIDIQDVATARALVKYIQSRIRQKVALPDKLLISSGDADVLKLLCRTAPYLSLAVVFHGAPLDLSHYLTQLPLRACHVAGKFVNEYFVRELVTANLPVRIIGVNNPDHIMRYINMGVTGIITDAPDIMSHLNVA